MVFLAQFSKSVKKYHVSILLVYYFKILGEALIQDFWSRYYVHTLIFFGKVRLPNFVCGTTLKSYIGGTDSSERQKDVFDKKMVFLAQFNILLGYYFKIFGEALIQDFVSWYYFKFF
jgi:hypothetical protein